MKKIFIVLFALMVLSFSACSKSEPKEITCEEIIKAYEDAGYIVEHHLHKEDMPDSDVICSIRINDSKLLKIIICILIDIEMKKLQVHTQKI